MRRTLMEFAARTPRHGLDVHLYPHTYYGFFVRGDRRNQQDERDRWGANAQREGIRRSDGPSQLATR